jgi:hypothetical protein
MPFIVHLLREDLDHWRSCEQRNTRYYYTPLPPIARVVASCSTPIANLVDAELFCRIHAEKMSDYKRTHIRLDQLRSAPPDTVTRLRLKIASADEQNPPKITLEPYIP